MPSQFRKGQWVQALPDAAVAVRGKWMRGSLGQVVEIEEESPEESPVKYRLMFFVPKTGQATYYPFGGFELETNLQTLAKDVLEDGNK